MQAASKTNLLHVCLDSTVSANSTPKTLYLNETICCTTGGTNQSSKGKKQLVAEGLSFLRDNCLALN